MMLGELLIAEGVLDAEGLQEALDWQVLYGGRLGTNLLELGLVQEETLARALGKQRGCEVAFGELQTAPEVARLVPAHIADRQEIVPWKLERRRLKLFCTSPQVEVFDGLAHQLDRVCTPVIVPEFRLIQLLRRAFGAKRQMRALDFGVVPEEQLAERRRRRKREAQGPSAEPVPELIDESAFSDIYAQVLAGRDARGPEAVRAPPSTATEAAQPSGPSSSAPSPRAPISAPTHPSGAVALARARSPRSAPAEPAPSAHAEAPGDSGAGDTAAPLGFQLAHPEPSDEELALRAGKPVHQASDDTAAPDESARSPTWEMPPPHDAIVDEGPLGFSDALAQLSGVTDRDAIAHVVLRCARRLAARALLLTVQGGFALGWDGLGDGLEGGAARGVAVSLAGESVFQLVIKTRSHYVGPLRKTPANVRFLAQSGKQIPYSVVVLPILFRGRVSHLLYLDNGHKQQAPTDIGEMLILGQRVTQTVDALVARKRRIPS